MKCMFVTRRIEGGIKTHLKTLVNRLPAHDITPVICGPRENFEEFEGFEGVEILDLPLEDGLDFIEDYKNIFKNIFRLKEYINSFSPDLVHSHGYKASLIVAITKMLVKFPWITTIHNFKPPYQSKKAFEIFVKGVLNKANKVQPVSYSLKKELISMGIKAENCSVLYNGVSLYPFHKPIAKNTSLPDGIKIGCIGRLNEDKGIDDFIYMIKYLHEKYGYYFNLRKYSFLIIGDGPQRKELQQLSWRLGLAPKIYFLGQREDVPEILKSLKLLCIPSKYEGLSITALEAMAAFCPVVATHKGGLTEIVKHEKTGLLVPSQSPEEMGEGIMTLIRSSKIRRRLTWKGYINVIENFTDEKMVKELVNSYRNLC